MTFISMHACEPSPGSRGSPLAAAGDSLRQLPTKMADICRDWPTDQTTDCCFVVIGSPGHPPVLCSTSTIVQDRSSWSAIFVGS